jgi:Predicted membrane protein (DUF2339)
MRRMEIAEEFFALRAEQARLRGSIDRLDRRVDDLEQRWSAPAPGPKTPEPVVAKLVEPIREEMPIKPVVPVVPPPLPQREIRKDPVHVEKPSRESLELRLGRVWLVRVGIVILLTGLVLLGNYAYHEYIGRLGPFGKLLLIALAGGTLCGLGTWLGKKQETLKNYARVLLAGGCATLYYAAYAAHFVETLRVIGSPIVGGSLLLALGGSFIALANRLRSETLAAATVALTFYVSAINPVGAFSLFSNLVICATAITLLARRRWVSVSFLSLVGAYGSHAFWRWQQAHTFLPVPVADDFWPAVLFPVAYWLVFTTAVMLRRLSVFDSATRPVFLTLNNAAFFALAGPVIAGTHPDVFWLAAVAYGVVLIALAVIAGRRSADEPLFDGTCLAQGIALILLGLVYKFTGWQEAISFALLCATLVALGRLRHGVIYRIFAAIAAVVSTRAVAAVVIESGPHARLIAGTVAVIFVFTAWSLRRQTDGSSRCDWRVLAFALLAAVISLPACIDASLQASALRILAVALVATATTRWLRLPEMAYAAQSLALTGQVLLVLEAVFHQVPTGSVFASAVAALAFVFLWKWQSTLGLVGRTVWQTLHLLTPVALTLWWSFVHLDLAQRGPALALIALAVLVTGWLTRTRCLTLASIPFTVVSVAFSLQSISEQVPWLSPAAAIGLLLVQSFLLPRATTEKAPSLCLRATCVMLGIAMVFAYVPASGWFLTMTLAALAFFSAGCVWEKKEAQFYAGLLFLVGALVWTSRLLSAPAQAADLLGFGAIVLAQQIGKRRLAGSSWFGAEIQAALATVAVLGSWIVLHRIVAVSNGGFLLTVVWSLLALGVIGGGFVLRDRTYRILGLLILASAVGRIFCVDIWQLETIYRILSFLVLGVVLLGLGFLYNRHAETLRRWL